jgi:predicted ArsR family transcriptional regulator
MSDELGAAARSIGALADPSRRAMYEFIKRRGAPVSRGEAAAAAGVSAKLAAFHLDKLVEGGLLDAHYARLPGRGGPGAGRSSKLYQPAAGELAVSIPPRSYDLAGRILLEALSTLRAGETPVEAARRVGYRSGEALSEDRNVRAARRGSPSDASEALLEELGFEPRREGTDFTLTNCPFHSLARHDPELVCGMNEAFVSGLLAGIPNGELHAFLAPQPGRCCVRVCETREAS